VANWHAARQAIRRLGADLTIHLGDLTLDARRTPHELRFAAELVSQWPHPMYCVPGNHDVGDGCGETPLDLQALSAYRSTVAEDHWCLRSGHWLLLGVNAQLFGTDSAEEARQWRWIEEQAPHPADLVHTALFMHRPLARLHAGETHRRGRYVPAAARERILHGPLRHSLRLVVSGHMHQHLDATVAAVRHVWLAPTSYVRDDPDRHRQAGNVVGIGILDLDGDEASLDLWCPQGLIRHHMADLALFRQMSEQQEQRREQLIGREAV
jgi:3',5'-cyclic AMP phosphodiesterase CpdA